jgi:hypothetical protein
MLNSTITILHAYNREYWLVCSISFHSSLKMPRVLQVSLSVYIKELEV